MVQQTTIRQSKNSPAFFNRVFGEWTKNREGRRSIAFLSEDYTAAMKLAAELTSHSKWIPYPFLVDHLKKISDELRGHAEIFRAKIIELGGQIVPERTTSAGIASDSRPSSEKAQAGHDRHGLGISQGGNAKKLVADMEEHSARCEALMHQKNLVSDTDIVILLHTIVVDMQRQEDELIDIIMKVS